MYVCVLCVSVWASIFLCGRSECVCVSMCVFTPLAHICVAKFVCFCLCCMCVYACVYVSVMLPISRFVYVYLCVCLSLCVRAPISRCVYVYLCVLSSLSLYLSVCLSSLSLSIYLSICMSSLYLRAFFSACPQGGGRGGSAAGALLQPAGERKRRGEGGGPWQYVAVCATKISSCVCGCVCVHA